MEASKELKVIKTNLLSTTIDSTDAGLLGVLYALSGSVNEISMGIAADDPVEEVRSLIADAISELDFKKVENAQKACERARGILKPLLK